VARTLTEADPLYLSKARARVLLFVVRLSVFSLLPFFPLASCVLAFGPSLPCGVLAFGFLALYLV
jgi:hypothetical protein